MKPPVFLDRDGVINENRSDYVRKPSQFKPVPGSLDAVRRLSEAGFPVVIVTNQSGIARGYYTRDVVLSIHSLAECALGMTGTTIAGIYFCPHHPDEMCGCRKPETGMVEAARKDHDLPPGGWIVGDADSDMELGRRSGLSTILVLTGRGAKQLEKLRAEGRPEPDHVVGSLADAADLILTP